jgi:hypothetical protein
VPGDCIGKAIPGNARNPFNGAHRKADCQTEDPQPEIHLHMEHGVIDWLTGLKQLGAMPA